jgi:hypothetical protein
LAARIAAIVVGAYDAHADVAPGVGEPQRPGPEPELEPLEVVGPPEVVVPEEGAPPAPLPPLADALLDEPHALVEGSPPPPQPAAASTSDREVDATKKRPQGVVFEEAIQITSSSWDHALSKARSSNIGSTRPNPSNQNNDSQTMPCRTE